MFLSWIPTQHQNSKHHFLFSIIYKQIMIVISHYENKKTSSSTQGSEGSQLILQKIKYIILGPCFKAVFHLSFFVDTAESSI